MPSPGSNTVSYQSAFLGLVPLALNAMTQPSFFDQPFAQSSLLFAARSSPVICIADSLEVFFEVVFYVLCHRSGFRDAAGRSCRRRARKRIGDDALEIEQTGQEKHPWALAVLSIAALLQAVKIFGMHGVPWTQVWAGVYFASFVVLALMPMIAQSGWREDDAVRTSESSKVLDKMSDRLAWLALVVHFSTCGWAAYHILCLEDLDDINKAKGYVPWMVMFTLVFVVGIFDGIFYVVLLIGLPVVTGLLIYYAFKFLWKLDAIVELADGIESLLDSAKDKVEAFCATYQAYMPLWLPYMFYICLFLLFSALSLALVEGWVRLMTLIIPQIVLSTTNPLGMFVQGLWATLFYLCAILVAVWILSRFTALLWRLGLCQAVSEATVIEARRPMLKRVVFALSNFIVGLLYYRLQYIPIGTVKPAWTENLG